MTEEEFLQRYVDERPMYEAWGDLVMQTIDSTLRNRLGTDADYYSVVKIPPTVRTKEPDSLLNKAFYRGKQYKDPYNDITDKVGLRFVVLLTDQINPLRDIVAESTIWTNSEDRNFEDERKQNPSTFAYESVHFVVKSIGIQHHNGQEIPEGTPCEIQIRTLLQHAYSEVTHDTVYKSKITAEPEIHRTIARSMALIDTTDKLLVEAKSALEGASETVESWVQAAKHSAELSLGDAFLDNYDDKTNWVVAENLVGILGNTPLEEFSRFVEERAFLADRIRERFDIKSLFRQPVILLVYFTTFKKRTRLAREWEFDDSILNHTYGDLGLADPRDR